MFTTEVGVAAAKQCLGVAGDRVDDFRNSVAACVLAEVTSDERREDVALLRESLSRLWGSEAEGRAPRAELAQRQAPLRALPACAHVRPGGLAPTLFADLAYLPNVCVVTHA